MPEEPRIKERRRSRPTALRLTLVTVLCIFLAEAVIMQTEVLRLVPEALQPLLDATLLITLSLPCMFFFVYRPLVEQIERQRIADAEREKLIGDLRVALGQVKTLTGLLPVCSWCKKIRDTDNRWSEMEEYLSRHSEADFTHSICPECFDRIDL